MARQAKVLLEDRIPMVVDFDLVHYDDQYLSLSLNSKIVFLTLKHRLYSITFSDPEPVKHAPEGKEVIAKIIRKRNPGRPRKVAKK